jgi:PPP family 3-phenylpropionic acid transporter
MTPAVVPPAPEIRLSAFYLTQFLANGIVAVYASIWMAERGLNPTEIGYVHAAPVLALIAVNLFVGRIADRADDWKGIIVIGCVLAAVFPVFLYVSGGFWPLLVMWSLATVSHAAVASVSDAATLRLTRRRGSDFGFIRGLGTLGFTLVLFLSGFVFQRFGSVAFLPLYIGLAAIRAAMSFRLPRLRAVDDVLRPPLGLSRLRPLLQPWFLLPLVGFAFVLVTHALLIGFQSLLWKQDGMSDGTIGIFIGIGATSEMLMFFGFRRFSGRFTARHLMLASALVSCLRWGVTATSPGLPLLALMQSLHGVTFALGYLGCINFIANWTNEDIAAEAQSLFVVVHQALTVIGLAVFGWAATAWGTEAYFLSTGMAGFGGLLIWLSLRLKEPAAT